jgi:hypothetical protein
LGAAEDTDWACAAEKAKVARKIIPASARLQVFMRFLSWWKLPGYGMPGFLMIDELVYKKIAA